MSFDELAGINEAKDFSAKVAKTQSVNAAIAKGLETAKRFTKEMDKVQAIKYELKAAGFQIVRKRGSKTEDEDTSFDELAGIAGIEEASALTFDEIAGLAETCGKPHGKKSKKKMEGDGSCDDEEPDEDEPEGDEEEPEMDEAKRMKPTRKAHTKRTRTLKTLKKKVAAFSVKNTKAGTDAAWQLAFEPDAPRVNDPYDPLQW